MLAQQRLATGRTYLRLLSARKQPRRIAASAPPRSMSADAQKAPAPELPDAICVHCGQRFNSAHLAYGFDTKQLCAEARGTEASQRSCRV